MKTKRMLFVMPDDLIAQVDRWRGKQPDVPNRSEAIRRLTTLGLKAKGVETAAPPRGQARHYNK